MTGSGELGDSGVGDPDLVLGVSPEQFLTHYDFFADPTFPETNLVLVRSQSAGAFADVTLDCLGRQLSMDARGSHDCQFPERRHM
jgi:hypothetical protein